MDISRCWVSSCALPGLYCSSSCSSFVGLSVWSFLSISEDQAINASEFCHIINKHQCASATHYHACPRHHTAWTVFKGAVACSGSWGFPHHHSGRLILSSSAKGCFSRAVLVFCFCLDDFQSGFSIPEANEWLAPAVLSLWFIILIFFVFRSDADDMWHHFCSGSILPAT